ncbi:hypothetical protein ACWEH1_13300 [Micromonospora chersina]
MLRPAQHLTDGHFRAEPHNAALPDLVIDVTAPVGVNQGSGRAEDGATVRLASCAARITRIRSTAAGTRAAQP